VRADDLRRDGGAARLPRQACALCHRGLLDSLAGAGGEQASPAGRCSLLCSAAMERLVSACAAIVFAGVCRSASASIGAWVFPPLVSLGRGAAETASYRISPPCQAAVEFATSGSSPACRPSRGGRAGSWSPRVCRPGGCPRTPDGNLSPLRCVRWVPPEPCREGVMPTSHVRALSGRAGALLGAIAVLVTGCVAACGASGPRAHRAG